MEPSRGYKQWRAKLPITLGPGTTPKSEWQATIKGGGQISSEVGKARIIQCRKQPTNAETAQAVFCGVLL